MTESSFELEALIRQEESFIFSMSRYIIALSALVPNYMIANYVFTHNIISESSHEADFSSGDDRYIAEELGISNRSQDVIMNPRNKHFSLPASKLTDKISRKKDLQRVKKEAEHKLCELEKKHGEVPKNATRIYRNKSNKTYKVREQQAYLTQTGNISEFVDEKEMKEIQLVRDQKDRTLGGQRRKLEHHTTKIKTQNFVKNQFKDKKKLSYRDRSHVDNPLWDDSNSLFNSIETLVPNDIVKTTLPPTSATVEVRDDAKVTENSPPQEGSNLNSVEPETTSVGALTGWMETLSLDNVAIFTVDELEAVSKKYTEKKRNAAKLRLVANKRRHNKTTLNALKKKNTKHPTVGNDVEIAALERVDQLLTDCLQRVKSPVIHSETATFSKECCEPIQSEAFYHSNEFIDLNRKFRENFFEQKSGYREYDADQESADGPIFKKVDEWTYNFFSPFGPHPEIMRSILPFVSYVYTCMLSGTITGWWLATNSLVRAFEPKVEQYLCNHEVHTIMGLRVREAFDSMQCEEISSESFSDKVDGMKNFFNTIITSKAAETFRDIFLLIVSFANFDSDVTTRIKTVFGKLPKMSVADLVNVVLEALKTLLRFGEAIYNGTPISEVLFSKSPISRFIEESVEMIHWRDKLYYGAPVEGKKHAIEYNGEVGKLIKVGEDLIKTLNPIVHPVADIRSKINTLRNIKFDIDNSLNNNKMRVPPLAFVIFGDPGIGKSNLITFIVSCYAKGADLKFTPDVIYHRTIGTTYWEGYDPWSQYCIHYSEIGATARKIAESQGDPQTAELTTVVDSQPMTVDMAFEGKGKVYAHPGVVVIDTNNPELNLKYIVNNPAAYMRRFIFIKPSVLPQFRKDGSPALDPEKALAYDGLPMDLYTFDVYLEVPDGVANSHKEMLLFGGSIFELAKLVVSRSSEHVHCQNKIKENLASLGDITPYLFDEVDCPSEKESEDDNIYETKEGYFDNDKIMIEDVISESGIFEIVAQNVSEVVKNQVGDFIDYGMNVTNAWFQSLLFSWLLYFFINTKKLKEFQWFDILWIVHGLVYWKWGNLAIIIILSYIARQYLFQWIRDYFYKQVFVMISLKARNMKFRLRQLLSFSENIYDSEWWNEHGKQFTLVAGALTTAMAALCAYNYIYPKPDVESKESTTSESHTDFKCQDAFSTDLNIIEEEMGCGTSYVRYNKAGSKIWNTKTNYYKPPAHTDAIDKLYKKILRNVRNCNIQGASNDKTYIFGLKGDLAIINTHALGGVENALLRVSSNGKLDGETHVWYDTLLTKANTLHLGNDITLIRLQSVLFADVMSHVIDGNDFSVPLNGYFFDKEVRITPLRGEQVIKDKNVGEFIVKNMWQYTYEKHRPGMCGLPLVAAIGNGAAICGIHTGGAASFGFSTFLTRDVLSVGVAKMLSTGMMPLMSESSTLNLDSLDPLRKSIIYYEKLYGVQYFGKQQGEVMINKTSRLKHTGLGNIVDEALLQHADLYVTETFGPPLMQPKMLKDGTYISPYNLAMNKIAKQKKSLNPDILNRTVTYISKHIIKLLERNGVTKLEPYTIDTAINGVKHDPFLRRINVRASAGFGYKGTKESYVPIVCDNEEELIRQPIEEVRKELLDMFRAKDLGECVPSVYVMHLKDEPRALEKIKSGKTRAFCGSRLSNLILSRMFLGPIYTLMVEFSSAFSCAIGINMHAGADKLFRELSDFSPFGMEGDYEGYDKEMPVCIGHAACTITYDILKHFGYSEEALDMTRAVLTGELFPIIDVLKDIFICFGFQPSGKYGTAEDNCIRGLVLLVYAWFSNKDVSHLDFFENVKPKTYGDDIAATIKSSVIEYYNNQTYQKFCREEYGMNFTNPNKTADMPMFVPVENLTFLKRTFVYNTEFKRYLAPLDVNSLSKMMTWYIPSGTVSPSEQILSTFESFQWELSLHTDCETYNLIVRDVAEEISKRYLVGATCPTLDYYDILSVVCEEELQPINILTTVHGERAVILSQSGSMPNRLLGKKLHYPHQSPHSLYSRTNEAFYESSTDYKYNTEIKIERNDVKSIDEIKYALEQEYSQAKKIFDPDFKGYTPQALALARLRANNLSYKKKCKSCLDHYAHLESLILTIKHYENILAKRLVINSESGEMTALGSEGAIAHEITHENLVDASGGEHKEAFAGQTTHSAQGQRGLLDIEDYFERPVRLYEGVLALNTDIEIALPVWDMYSLVPSVRAKFRNYAYMRGDLRVRVAISGTSFHYGRMLVSYQPFPLCNDTLQMYQTAISTSSNFAPAYINYLSQAPGSMTMDVKENIPVEIVCPFISTKPMFRLFNQSNLVISDATSFVDFENAGTLIIKSINRIKAVTATPSTVYVQVYAWMENLELGVSTATQIQITTESGSMDERKTGPIQRFASSAKSISKALKTVPILTPFAMAGEIAFGALGSIAAIFGWSKPVKLADTIVVKNEPFQNGAQLIGTDTSKRITLDPKQEITVDPRVCGSTEDEMTFRHICERRTYLTTFSWNENSPVLEDTIWATRVSPSLVTSITYDTLRYNQPTAMAFCAAPFEFWRGDIIFRFEVVASSFHRGKLAIYYEPNQAHFNIITPTVSLNKQYIKVIDIQDTQVFDIRVEWAAYRSWLRVSAPGEAYLNTSNPASNSGARGYVNGFLAVVPFTALQSPDNSDVSVNVYVMSDNMEFNVLSRSNIPTERFVIESESGPMSDVTSASSNTSHMVSCLSLNPSTATTHTIAIEHFGERPVSFRSLLKRYVTVVINALGASTSVSSRFVMPNIPPNQLPYNVISAPISIDILSYLRYAYLGMKGGMRYRVNCCRRNVSDLTSTIRVSLLAPTDTWATPGTTQSGYPSLSYLEGTVVFLPNTMDAIEYEVPFYTNNLFLLSFKDDLVDSTGDIMSPWFTRNHMISFDNRPDGDDTYLTVDMATAEDFTLLRYQGCPLYTQTL